MAIRKITVERAAALLGKSTMFVRECMKRGSLPIGTAEQMPGSTRWTFIISPTMLAEYMGCSVSDLYDTPAAEQTEQIETELSEEQIRTLCRAFERFLRTEGVKTV